MSDRIKGDKNPAKTPEARKKNSDSHKKLRAIHKLNGTGYYSKEYKAIQQEAQGGANNGRANEYIFTDKNNIEYSVKGKINEFCTLNVIRMDWVWDVLKNKTNDNFNGWSVRLVNDRGTRNSIYKDNEQKFVFDDELDIYLVNGWQLGSKPRKSKKLTPEQIIESVNKRKATLRAQREQGIFTSLKGKKRDPESVRKGVEKRKGKPSILKGSKRSEEFCKNVSARMKANPIRLLGEKNPMYGKPRSEETKRKISETKARKKLEKSLENKG
jgi:hypothetical protein